MQALITSTTSIVTEAAATIGQIDRDLFQRLAPTLEATKLDGDPPKIKSGAPSVAMAG